jgi:hypothetical protein
MLQDMSLGQYTLARASLLNLCAIRDACTLTPSQDADLKFVQVREREDE